MKIRGLLAGSAAAIATASSAYAADPIVYVEPEPMEYVRICDVYGAGFFYIPGTETCLQISGHVFYDILATTEDDAGDTAGYYAVDSDGFTKGIQARVNFDARSETEWGTLRSYIRIQASDLNSNRLDGSNGIAPGGDFDAQVDQAFIELGGLRMGYTESAWVETANGGASGYGSHSWGGLFYAYQQRMLISYNFGANGFFGTVSLEDDGNEDGPNNYMPDVVGVLGYGLGWGTVWGKVAYDESAEAFAASLGTQINIPGFEGSSLRLIGYYAEDPVSGINAYSPDNFGLYSDDVEWSFLGSYFHRFTPTFGASVGGQYLAFHGGSDGYAAELNLVWTPIQNFEVSSEIVYTKEDGLDGTTSGFLRFKRSF
jgi:hypothetical protein